MSRISFLASVAACVVFLFGQADAQVIQQGWQGRVVTPGQFPQGQFVAPAQFPQGQFVAPTQPFFPGQVINQGQVFVPGQFNNPYGYQRPSVAVGVTPNQATGWNPQTGGLNTANAQVNNTFYDPGRNMSQFNNTRRWVRRPVYGANGQVAGYQEGTVWNNSLTGQEHGNLKSYTPNQQGGVHEEAIGMGIAR